MKGLTLLIAILSATIFVVGCGSSSSTSKAEEAKEFAGGPMPPDAQKQFEASQKASQDALAAKLKGNTGPPPQ